MSQQSPTHESQVRSVTGSGFLTIGHSNRSLDEFIELLQAAAVAQVIDVRKLPGSSKFPQFNQEALGDSLARYGIELIRLEALAGRRLVSKNVPFEVNAWWQNRSFHNYADHALSREFHETLATLRERGSQRRTVLMCAEAVWWRCHRRIITDHLLALGEEVLHILGKNQLKLAELSKGAVISDECGVSYPATINLEPCD